nr:LytTR family DNA-binding domain-containing protein [Enterococcus sp. 669A]
MLAAEKTGQSVSDDAFIFQNKYTNLQIPYSDIYYFETTGTSHKLRLVAAKKVLEFYGELKEIETMDERLLRCHRAFVINLDNIVSIDRTNKTVRFPNGDECLISRRLIKEVTNKINQ